MRVITTDDYHTILQPFRPNEIEVIEQTSILCKINVRGNMSPARFFITFKNEMSAMNQTISTGSIGINRRVQKLPDLKVYLSSYHKEPNEHHNEKFFANQKKFVFGSVDKSGKFSNQEWIYLSFFSLAGCSIIVSVSFPQDNKDSQQFKKSQQVHQVQTLPLQEGEEQGQGNVFISHDQKRDIKEIEESLMQTLKQYNQTRIQDDNQSHAPDFIIKNKSLISHWNCFKGERRSQFTEQVQQKVNLALQRKEELEIEKRKKNLFGLYKWDFIRQKKIRHQKETEEQIRRISHKNQWIQFMHQHMIVKAIYEKFSDCKRQIDIKRRMKYAAKFLMRVSKKFFTKFAKTFQQRAHKKAQLAFVFSHTQLKDTIQARAQKKIAQFLTDTSKNYDLKQKFIIFYQRIMHIQHSYRNRCQCLDNRKNFLINYFDKERAFLVKFYIQKKSKRSKHLVKRLNLIDQDVRDKILKIYFEKCTFDYSVKFNQWRIKMHGENSGVDQESMTTRNEMLLQKEQLLFQGTEIVEEDQTAAASKLSSGNSGTKSASESIPSSPLRRQRVQTFRCKKGTSTNDNRKGSDMPPIFLSMPSREVLHKLIIKATEFKTIDDLNNTIK